MYAACACLSAYVRLNVFIHLGPHTSHTQAYIYIPHMYAEIHSCNRGYLMNFRRSSKPMYSVIDFPSIWLFCGCMCPMHQRPHRTCMRALRNVCTRLLYTSYVCETPCICVHCLIWTWQEFSRCSAQHVRLDDTAFCKLNVAHGISVCPYLPSKAYLTQYDWCPHACTQVRVQI